MFLWGNKFVTEIEITDQGRHRNGLHPTHERTVRLSGNGFFDSPEEQSIVKTKLVTKYFGAWTKVMLPHARNPQKRIAFVDLFSGPGKFEDGRDSTPLWILRNAIDNPQLCSHLVTFFNDKNKEYAEALQTAINALPGINKLKYQPVVKNDEIGTDVAAALRRLSLVPTLFFIDPWGYKGLSLDLIGSAIKSWGCDCIFFFNYNRINPGLNNPFVADLMNDLFGADRVEHIRHMIDGLPSDDRQLTIINELAEALRTVGGRFTLPFEFKSRHGERTSHYIIFVSKDFLGYHIMKDVMAGLSSDNGDVKSFQYVPVKSQQLSFLSDFAKPHSLPALKELILANCAGQERSVWSIYEQYSVDTPYTLRNFQDAMLNLETEGKLIVQGSSKGRKRNGNLTLGRDRIVSLPS